VIALKAIARKNLPKKIRGSF